MLLARCGVKIALGMPMQISACYGRDTSGYENQIFLQDDRRDTKYKPGVT